MEAYCHRCRSFGGHIPTDCPATIVLTERQKYMQTDRTRTVSFYLYREKDTGLPVYVGRTVGGLSQRDSDHRSAGKAYRAGKEWAKDASIFDRGYYHKGQYTLDLLETRTWTTYAAYRFGTYHVEQLWISKFGTMHTPHGRNCPTEKQQERLGWRVPETTVVSAGP